MRYLKRLKALRKAAKRHLRRWTAWVTERLAHEPGYAEATVNLAISVAELLIPSSASRRLVVSAARMVLVLLRTSTQQQPQPDPGPNWS